MVVTGGEAGLENRHGATEDGSGRQRQKDGGDANGAHLGV